jgi:threonyl-tRNA synthetase
MLVIGDKEVETATVSPRFRDGTNLPPMGVDDFTAQLLTEMRDFR